MTTVKINSSFDLKLPFDIKPAHTVELPNNHKGLVFKTKINQRGQRNYTWGMGPFGPTAIREAEGPDTYIDGWRVIVEGPKAGSFDSQDYVTEQEVNERLMYISRRLLGE